MAMNTITTHILDISRGKPAAGVKVVLEHHEETFKPIAAGVTDADGRVREWRSADQKQGFDLKKGTWRIRFEIQSYFEGLDEKCFYPFVEIVFLVDNAEQHYHVPLLLSAYGYSTYRGS